MSTTTAAPPRAAAGVFWRYWAAGASSELGSQVTAVALPLAAVSVLHVSAFEASLITAASYVAWLAIGLPAGVLVQRLPLRAMQTVMDLLRAVAIGSLPVAWWLGHLTLAHLVLAALVVNFASVLFDVGNMTMLPSIVPPEQLAARNSLQSGTHATTQLAGPSLGGLLVQMLGALPTLIVDTVSYLVSAVLMRTLPKRRVAAPAQQTGVGEMVRDGWRFVMAHPVIRPCMWDATAANFVCGALMALTPVYLVRELAAPAAVVGILIAAEGVGALLGSALCPWIRRRWGSARAVLGGNVVGALLFLLMPAGSGHLGWVLFAVGNAGFAAGTVVTSICTRTHRQTAAPPEMLSRVMATVRFVSWGAVPFGALLAGLVASSWGLRPALWLAGVLAFVPYVILALSPVGRLRDLEDG